MGTAPPQTSPLAAYGASILATSALDLLPPLPQCSSGVDAHEWRIVLDRCS